MRCAWLLVAVLGCGKVEDVDGDAGTDAAVPEACPSASCIADAAADFGGTPGGGPWRYLEDRRDRTWVPMTATAGAMVGADPRNRIQRCADDPSAAACRGLPGALLVSSSGTASAADPALEYRSPDARVIRLALRAHVPGGGADHRVRLYRNSREDVLVTAAAAPGGTVKHELIVDALPGDRFLVALEPTGPVGGPAALHLFVSEAGMPFPSTCQLAVPFTPGSTPTTVDNLCGGDLAFMDGTTPVAPLLRAGPFPEHGMAGYFEPTFHYQGTAPLARSGATTFQFWVQHDGFISSSRAWVFSDIDQGTGGGLGLQLVNGNNGLQLEASAVGGTNPPVYTGQRIDYPSPLAWHFVRVIHGGGTVTLCLDGRRAASGPLPGPTTSQFPPYLGQNVVWDTITYFLGGLDDVRVFAAALPCD